MSYEEKLKEELELVRCDLHNAYSWLESKEQENEQRIDKALELLGNYRHYCVPDELSNRENEELVDKAYETLEGDK